MRLKNPLIVNETYVFHLESAGDVPVLRYRKASDNIFHVAEFARGKTLPDHDGTFAAFDAILPFYIGKTKHHSTFKLLIPLSDREQKQFSVYPILTLMITDNGAVLKGGAFEDEILCQTAL